MPDNIKDKVVTLEDFKAAQIAVRPDWEQNDENALDYIENRPFYDLGTVETTFVKSDGTLNKLFDSEGESVYVAPVADVKNDLVVGSTVTVKINDTVYENMEVRGFSTQGEIVPYVGDNNLEEYQFAAVVSTTVLQGEGIDGGYYIDIRSEDFITYFEIIGEIENIVKIPQKYLPDIGVSAIEVVEFSFDGSTGNMVASKSASEIISAYDSGKLPVLVMSGWIGFASQLNRSRVTATFAEIAVEDGSKYVKQTFIEVDDNKIISVEERRVNTLPPVTSSDNNKVLTVINGRWDTGDIPSGLPAVTSSDNDKVLTVINGSWAKGNAPTSLPSVTSSDNDKILTVVNGEWDKGNAPTLEKLLSGDSGADPSVSSLVLPYGSYYQGVHWYSNDRVYIDDQKIQSVAYIIADDHLYKFSSPRKYTYNSWDDFVVVFGDVVKNVTITKPSTYISKSYTFNENPTDAFSVIFERTQPDYRYIISVVFSPSHGTNPQSVTWASDVGTSGIKLPAKYQTQAIWDETDNTSASYIWNKPDVYTKDEIDAMFQSLPTYQQAEGVGF